MNYQVNITSTKSGTTRNFNYWLDFQPTETTKIKSFVTAFNTLLEGKAVVTEIKAKVFEVEKPALLDINYSTKIMYEVSGGGMINTIIPYLDTTIKSTTLTSFMMQYFEGFKSINNVLHKREF